MITHAKTITNRSLTFGIETVHHPLNNIQFVLNGEVDEVGVNKDMIGGTQLHVVLEEQGRGDLRTVRNGRGREVRWVRDSFVKRGVLLSCIITFLVPLFSSERTRVSLSPLPSFSSALPSPDSSF